MPELPDLIYIEAQLQTSLSGQRISSVNIREPLVIRCLLDADFDSVLVGKTIKHIHRHGPFLVFGLDNRIVLIVHPMLAGKFQLAGTGQARGRGLSFQLQFENDSTLSYFDDKRMGKVYLLPADQTHMIPKFENQGLDLLSDAFTEKAFLQVIRKQRKQVRVFLMQQSILSCIGNADADEILFEAGIHPKTFCYQLDEGEKLKLFQSIGKVMRWGINEVKKAAQPIEVKVRGHMKVRNRRNEPCPNCSTTIRRAGVLGHDSFFCPKCQPAKREQFIPWEK